MPHLGMYVHMHWGYAWPYAARTWRLQDWGAYASGLKALGYNTVLIWPVFETVPDPPTGSDRAHLEKMRQVIEVLHREDMQVGITLGPNTVSNARAAEYNFAERPFFLCDERLDPGDPAQMERLLSRRRPLLEHVRQADFFAIIDSDPGGWIGSTADEFADLLIRHLEMMREINPRSRLFYWMWAGWEPYNRMWAEAQQGRSVSFAPTLADFAPVLRRLAACPAEAWGVFSCWRVHQEAAVACGLRERALFYPYGLVEGEPTFPLTNWQPARMAEGMVGYDLRATALGVMANAQTHVVQAPHTWLFAHLAQGGKPSDAGLVAFADGLVPGCGRALAEAWQALGGEDERRMRGAAGVMDKLARREHGAGPYSGLLVGGAALFLEDLALQLRFKAAAREFIKGGRRRLPDLVAAWSAWQQRTGFADAYGDTLNLHPALRALGEGAVSAALDDFDNWREPGVRHGVVTRLLAALREVG